MRNQILISTNKNYWNTFYAEKWNLFIWKRCDIFFFNKAFPAIVAAILISRKFVLSVTLRRQTL